MDYLELFQAQNPWQNKQNFGLKPFINRKVLTQILKWLKRDEIITITGPRQAGKSTILLRLIKLLIEDKKQPPTSIYYFNFDQEEFQEEFKKPQQLLSFVKSRTQYKRYWLFLDEAQRLKEAGLYLKILYDLPQKPFKMIVSGSSSLLLRAKIKEYLTGRQVEFRLLPLSFKEGAKKYGFQLPAENSNELQSLLKQFIVYGGYPNLFQENNLQIKKQLLVQLYQDYVKKDIRDFAGVEKATAFNKLTGLLAYQVGNLINKNELAVQAQTDARTITKYLEILEQTFVIKLLKPYFTNRRKEIAKSPKIFYLDNGLRNVRLNNFEKYEARPDKGQLFENLVLTELIKYRSFGVQLRFWRTQAGAEVDFILVSGKNLIPVEAKTIIKKAKITKSLKSFIINYQPKQAFIISENFTGKKRYQKTMVRFIPFSKLRDVFSNVS